MLLFKAPWRAILIKFIVKLSFNGIFWKGRTQDPRSLTLVLIPLIGYRCFVLGSTSLPRGGAFAKTTTNLSSCVYWLATHPSKHLKAIVVMHYLCCFMEGLGWMKCKNLPGKIQIDKGHYWYYHSYYFSLVQRYTSYYSHSFSFLIANWEVQLSITHSEIKEGQFRKYFKVLTSWTIPCAFMRFPRLLWASTYFPMNTEGIKVLVLQRSIILHDSNPNITW